MLSVVVLVGFAYDSDYMLDYDFVPASTTRSLVLYALMARREKEIADCFSIDVLCASQFSQSCVLALISISKRLLLAVAH